jgi:hypothetical protein
VKDSVDRSKEIVPTGRPGILEPTAWLGPNPVSYPGHELIAPIAFGAAYVGAALQVL